MPIGKGLVGVCRVLRIERGANAFRALVAACDWIKDQPPTLDDPAVRRILALNHHSWKDKKELVWVTKPPPANFQILGVLKPSANDQKELCTTAGGWESIPPQILAQWRWDHDRAAVLAEDATKGQFLRMQQTDRKRRREEYLATVTLADLLTKDLFEKWKTYPPEEAKDGCRNILRTFIQSLQAAGVPADPEFARQHLKSCVLELNQLDEKHNHFIETGEREDLCEVLEEVLHAAKVPALADEIHRLRDW